MEIVFATNNENKIIEVQKLLPSHIKILGLKDIGCLEDIPETAETLEGNAILKAKYVFEKYGYDCFADDSGLEIEALGGAPGVYSARFAGMEKNDQKNMAKVLNLLENESNRKAQFSTCIALIIQGQERILKGVVEGEITSVERGENGFGYDPIFVPKGCTETFAEMNLSEKSKISHRAIATRKLIDFLNISQ